MTLHQEVRAVRTLWIGLGALWGMLGLAAGAAAEGTPPNVVLIVADDMGWTDYGFMGHPHIRTPRLDRLAAEGLVFRRGYVASSLCRPSLMTILSGLYPHQHRITSNDPPVPEGVKKAQAERNEKFLADRQRMIAYADRVPTLPRLLQQRGYVSFQTGKWWEGDFRRGGFSEGMSQGGRHGDQGLGIGRTTMEPMFEFVRRATAQGKPFFLWYAPMLPHTPHNPPQRLLSRYESLAPTENVAKYWAMCEWFDETCGQLLDFLDDRGLRDQTLVVYITDNGWIQSPEGNQYAPRSKQSPYDGGLRTPIMLRLPGRIAPRHSEALAHSIDLAPTVLAVAGLAATPDMQGINLLDEQALAARHAVFGECFEHNAVDIERPVTSLRWRWCIQGHDKLIVPHAPNVVGAPELFDLVNDPHEAHNRASSEPATVARLSALLDAWWSGQ